MLVLGRGEALEVSENLQEADLEFFRLQRRRLQSWLEQGQQEGGTKEKGAGR